MANSPLLTVLHISDFHYTRRKQREQGIVVDALIEDLQKICIGHRKPDIVIFSGDLVQAAGIDLHEDAYDFLLDKVSKATGCSDERIFIAPGNHDLSWTGLEQFSADTKGWRDLAGVPTEAATLNNLYDKGAFDAAVTAKFSHYQELERFLNGDPRHNRRKLSNSFVTVDRIAELDVEIAIFNTAVFSAGGHKSFEADERKLMLPEYPVLEVAKVLSKESVRIFVTHHPFGMLSESSARMAEGEFAGVANIHLFGHMHDPQPRKVVGLKGEVLTNQSGAIFTSRKDSYNGYALITYDRSTGFAETMVRSYFADRGEFDEGTDIIEGGRWWSSQEARKFFHKIADPVDESEFRQHLSGSALEALNSRESASGGEDEAHGRFVPPPLRRTFIREVAGDETKVEVETPVAFSDVVEGDANLILYARAEFGRTSLLRELRYRLLEDAGKIRFPRLPILIDFKDISFNADNVLRKVRGGAELAPTDHDVEALLKLGHACIMIDDVVFSDAARMRALRDFVQRFPKSRYILSSPQSSATQLGACIDPEMPLRFEFVEIREFRRSDMRQLLTREERCPNVEEWLDRLQDEFREINLPFTAANGTILIDILSERYNFTAINRSVLMEQFIDTTLRKAAIDQSKRETFDYTNKTDLLSHIAAWMAINEEYAPPKERLREEVKAYLDARGLNAGIDALLDEFLAIRIFVTRSEERICFRYRGVLEYFIALRMTIDTSFRDWVLEEKRYLSYSSELQYYAGKLRNDSALIDLIANRHAALLAETIAEEGDVDIRQLESLQLPRDNEEEDVKLISAELSEDPLSVEEKDAELDRLMVDETEDRQDVIRNVTRKKSDLLAVSLFLYSGLVKNMELISDADKRRHLREIWNGWARLLMHSLSLAPLLAKERRIRISGALYEVQAPQGMDDATLLRKMMLLLPHIHVQFLSGAVGTEKLERQFVEPELREEDEPKIIEFLRTGVISELRLPSTPAAVDALFSKLRENPYLLWSFIVHVGELRRLGRVREEHFKKLEIPLASAISNLRGGSSKDRANEKRRQLARLARDRLMLTMRRDLEWKHSSEDTNKGDGDQA